MQRWGSASGLRRYRCAACRKTFNALTGTSLARLRKKACWLRYGEALAAGMSLAKAAAHCGVHLTTSFRWRHRFLRAPAAAREALGGVVEADETFFRRSHKGSRRWRRGDAPPGRGPHRRGERAGRRGLSAEQVPALIARDRAGHTADAVLPGLGADAIAAALGPVVAGDAVLCSDGAKAYATFAAERGLHHEPVNLAAGVRVRDGAFHIQNVNAYHGRLKGWMGRFNGVATRYLPNYLGWRRTSSGPPSQVPRKPGSWPPHGRSQQPTRIEPMIRQLLRGMALPSGCSGGGARDQATAARCRAATVRAMRCRLPATIPQPIQRPMPSSP